jgi:hypothetical protein
VIRDEAAVRCRAPTRRTRAALYRAVARALATAGTPATAVLESVAPDPIPWVTVRPANLLAHLRAATPDAYGPLDFGEPPPAPRPPAGRRDRIGLVAAGSRPVPGREAAVPFDLPRLDPLIGPTGWLATQTVWARVRGGALFAARRFRYATVGGRELGARFAPVARAVACDWSDALGTVGEARAAPAGARRAWRRRSVRAVPATAWTAADVDAIARTAEPRGFEVARSEGAPSGHAVVLGSSGAGKTTYLARRASDAIARGEAVLVLDLHGDLAPSIVARLVPEGRARVMAVDAGAPPVPGIAALATGNDRDRTAALLVAALKRLTADGTDVYWGFRLERIFDTFVRLVQEMGGSLVDLYDLLTDEDRRDAARLGTRRPELARFLEELRPVVRRNPEFLWPAATRLSKIVLVPALGQLLAPEDGGLPVEELVAGGSSILVRLPMAQLGPEAASFAGTLLLARFFLGIAGSVTLPSGGPRVLLVLDEVQAFSPRLVAEVLAESRKFGLRTIVATQYPERLAPELRSAAAGATTQVVAFRVPPAAAGDAGEWLGLDRSAAARILPTLPPGRGVELDPDFGTLRALPPAPLPGADPSVGWTDAVDRTRRAYLGPAGRPESAADEGGTERLLLAILAAEEEGRPLTERDVVPAAIGLPGPALDSARLGETWRSILRRGWAEIDRGMVRLSISGSRVVGLTTTTGAANESTEHRRLLVAAFRIFARRGYRLEILRQGRFDTTLPDAYFGQLGAARTAGSPAELAMAIDRARRGWAWRFFGGRDVHVEAEVSGALRPERLRHGWRKAAARDAVALFVVGDARRALRVRDAMSRGKVPRDRAMVWTLPELERSGPPNP